MILDLKIQKIKEIELDFENVYKNCFAKRGEPLYDVHASNQFFDLIGCEHYRLLAYLSTQFHNVEIFDIGTSQGHSALALSFNAENRVLTFNIEDEMSQENKDLKWKDRNIELFLDNLWEPEKRKAWESRLLASPLLFIDVDPHNGKMEYEFYQWLKANKYKGIAVFDDVHVTDLMEMNLWERIPEEYKIDVTSLGHFTGTGIIRFPWSTIEIIQ